MSLMACHLEDRNIALISTDSTGDGVMEDKLKKLLMRCLPYISQDISEENYNSEAYQLINEIKTLLGIDNIDNKIDEWHDSKSQLTLPEYLGITKEQYEKWVQEGFI